MKLLCQTVALSLMEAPTLVKLCFFVDQLALDRHTAYSRWKIELSTFIIRRKDHQELEGFIRSPMRINARYLDLEFIQFYSFLKSIK